MTRDCDWVIYYYIIWQRPRPGRGVPTSLTISIMMMPYSC